MSTPALAHGRGAGNRQQDAPTVQAAPGLKSHAAASKLQVQSTKFVPQHFPFQPLPPPNGQPPFRFEILRRQRNQITAIRLTPPPLEEGK